MTRTTRRILFYSFVAVFFAATPPTILYSMGYSLDWENKGLVQTGGIYLKSIPVSAQIFLNGEDANTSPRLISRLLPKNYEVTLTKDGYFPWKKNFNVSPKLVTEARNIILFPQNVQPELFDGQATTTIQARLMEESEKRDQIKANLSASSSPAWIFKSGNLYYFSENYVLYRTDLNNLFKSQVSKNELPKGKYSLISSNSGSKIMALASDGTLYWLNNDSNFEKIALKVKSALFSPDEKKLLWLTDNEIWIQWTEEYLTQPYRQAGDREMITRFAQPISQAIFYPDSEHVAFVVGDQIKITELDGRDRRNTVDFIKAPKPSIYFDAKQNYFYYLAQNQLFRLKLES